VCGASRTPTCHEFKTWRGSFNALSAAALFGAATPLAEALLGSMSPFLLAGLFYLGSGVGLGVGIIARRPRRPAAEAPTRHRLQKAEVP